MKIGLRKTKGDKIFDVSNYIFLSLLIVLFLYPLIFIVSASISDPTLVTSGKMWLVPKGFNLDGYKRIFANKDIWLGYKNTLLYTFIGIPINLFMTVTAAYPLSRKDFMPRKIIMWIYMFTMFFGGGLIPTYLLIKNIGLLNNFWVMIIPSAVSVWNIIITRTYFQSNIPNELREAADIDGCSNMKFLYKIVLPLSAPIIAVMGLFYGVGHWNAFFQALIYLSDRKLFPLQLILRDILISNQIQTDMLTGLSGSEQAKILQISQSIKYGVIIVASVPVLIAYPFIQKYFVKGIMVGSLKG